MKLIRRIAFLFSILPALALDKDCRIENKFELQPSSETFPISIYLSPNEKLIIQIKFKDLEYAYDQLKLSSNECSVVKKRDKNDQNPKKELLPCSGITDGWHQANISITQTELQIGSFLNYTLDHPVSDFGATANYSSYCQEKSPTWYIQETSPIKIPLTGLAYVNLILESEEPFSPILDILGIPLTLSWKSDSIATSRGPPLPEGRYDIAIYNKSKQIILTVHTNKCDCEASLTSLGEPLNEIEISSAKGTFYSILNFDNRKIYDGSTEAPIDEPTKEEPSNQNIHNYIVPAISGVAILITIIGCVYYVKKHTPTMKDYKKVYPEDDGNINQRIKVDKEDIIKNYSQLVASKNEPILKYKLMMKEDHKDSVKKVQKLSLGPLINYKQTKTILILGATGTGKSTTINTMVNYLLGIQLDDKERYVMIDKETESSENNLESQTQFMTAYILPYQNGMPNDCNYIIIDTPGFGDTRGFEQDQETMLQLENFLKQDYNISHVDIVGFVVKSAGPRLTDAQKYIYDGLFSMFGKDIGHNIFLLVTFSVAGEPPVLENLKAAEIKYNDYCKLNNSSLFCTYNEHSKTDESSFSDPEMIRNNWKMTEEGLHKFFGMIPRVNSVSLLLTKVVLEENARLRLAASSLQKKIEEGLDSLTQQKEKEADSVKPEEAKLIEQSIIHTEEMLVNSIKDAQQLAKRLREIPLRLDPLSVHGYIEKLIRNEEKEKKPKYEQRMQALKKLKEENSYLKAVINKEESSSGSWLQYFQKLKEE